MTKYYNTARFQKAAYYFLMLAIFFAYWLLSRQYKGPAYLSDEIGYLTKAAAFAGYPVDMASSWHGGYSLMLSPLFFIFSDPILVWQGIMLMNALIWLFSFLLLFHLLEKLFPHHSFWMIYFAVAVSAIYPSWISMSGYAFSTTGFVVIYILSLVLFLNIHESKTWTIVPYAILTGFLYWVHPTGLAVIMASFFIVIKLAWHTKRLAFVFYYTIIVAVMTVSYGHGVHAWLNEFMTPDHYLAANHYGSISTVLKNIFVCDTLVFLMASVLGYCSYLLISTFGIIGYSIKVLFETNPFIKNNIDNKHNNIIPALLFWLMFFSLLGIIIMGPNGLASHQIKDVDNWIYGRYSEMVLLPLLAIGILVIWEKRYALFMIVFLLFSGFVIHIVSNDINTNTFINKICIQAFWPLLILPQANFLSWFALGSAGIILTAILNRRYFIFLVAPIFLLSAGDQVSWHKNIISHYSKPTNVVDIVRSNFHYGNCIGFDPLQPPAVSMPERRNLYSYYFFNYDFRRMSYEEWSKSCDGPYFTYRANEIKDSGKMKIMAREKSSGLFLVFKKNKSENVSLDSVMRANDLYISTPGNYSCLVAGCFSMSAKELQRFSNVGIIQDDAISSDGKAGFLFYGPYRYLKRGNYYLQIHGKYLSLSGVVLDIVSDKGEKKYLKIMMNRFVDVHQPVAIPFTILADVYDLQVRLQVSADSDLKISGYEINTRNN